VSSEEEEMSSLSSSPSGFESLLPHILCFEHCGKKVFSVSSLPEQCPSCSTDLLDCDLKIPPFAVPSPFKRAIDFPCSIVIKPTTGTFLTDYTNKSNLHIAVTDSRGEVVEFDQHGLHRERSLEWNQCLVVGLAEAEPLVADMVGDPDWGEYWDLCLDHTLANKDWSSHAYSEEENNCFSFVLSLLTELNQHPFTEWASSKVSFCQKLILPKTVLAGKYIMLFRKLQQNNGLIVQ